MRILFYMSNLSVGGCQINAINLAVALKNRGHVVFILSDSGVLIQRLIDNGIGHVHINQNVRHFSIKNSLIIARFVKKLKIDLVQAFDPIFSIEAYTSKYFHGRQTLGMITAQRDPVFYLPKFCPTLFVNPSIIDAYLKIYNWNSNCTYLLVERLDLNVYYPSSTQSYSFIKQNHAEKKIITLVSRLDLDKLPSINLFIKLVEFVNIMHGRHEYIFYLAGDGSLITDIERNIIEKGLQGALFLLGQVANINELINSSYAVVAMASTCQQSLAVGKPTFVIGNSGFLQLVEESNFKELSYFHFNVHEKSTKNPDEYFYYCLINKLNTQDFLQNYFLFAISSAKLFSSIDGAIKLERLYESIFLIKFNFKNWVFHTYQLIHSYISYFIYLILRKFKCAE